MGILVSILSSIAISSIISIISAAYTCWAVMKMAKEFVDDVEEIVNRGLAKTQEEDNM